MNIEKRLKKLDFNNLSKYSEDALEMILDAAHDLGLQNSEKCRLIDNHLNWRAEEAQRIENERKAKADEVRRQKLEALKELDELVAANGRVVMKAMVEEFGSSYRDDYEITEDFTVISHCINYKNPNQKKKWTNTNLQDAIDKVSVLVYYRVYNDYFRENPSADTLQRLNAVIKELKRP